MTRRNQDVPRYYSGDSLQIAVTVTDADDDVVDITGASIDYGLFDVDGTAVTTKSTGGGGITITDAENGKFQININPADTENLAGDDFTHECQVTDSLGNVSTIFTGTVEILEDKLT